MSNKYLLMMRAMLNSLGVNNTFLDFDEDDIKFFDNVQVNDVIFATYIDLLRMNTIETDEEKDLFIEKMADSFHQRLATLSSEEQEYVKKKISEVINGPEDDKPMILEKRKDD